MKLERTIKDPTYNLTVCVDSETIYFEDDEFEGQWSVEKWPELKDFIDREYLEIMAARPKLKEQSTDN